MGEDAGSRASARPSLPQCSLGSSAWGQADATCSLCLPSCTSGSGCSRLALLCRLSVLHQTCRCDHQLHFGDMQLQLSVPFVLPCPALPC